MVHLETSRLIVRDFIPEDAVKSVSLMQKLGMQLEGAQRSQTKDNNGNWADLHLYGLLMDDWRLLE